MSADDPTSSSSFELPRSDSPPLFADNVLLQHSTPTQSQQTTYFTPHNGRPLSVFDNARLNGKRPWASVDCGPGSPQYGGELARSAGTPEVFYSPESEHGGRSVGGYADSPGMSSVLEQMSLGQPGRGSPSYDPPTVVFDNPSPFETTIHTSPYSHQVYISPNQPLQPLPHGTPSREPFNPHQQEAGHLSTPVYYHLSNSSSLSSMASNEIATPPSGPYQVLGPDGLVYVSTPVRASASHGQLQSPYHPQQQQVSVARRPVMKRSRSTLSSSPHEYDSSSVANDSDRTGHYNGWADGSSVYPSPSRPLASEIGHSPHQSHTAGRPEKKNKRMYESEPLLWSADGSELPDELRGWTPETMQDAWKAARGDDYKPSTAASKRPIALTVDQEIAFLTACYYLPVLGRARVLFFGRLCGRNEIISTFVSLAEGRPEFYRSKKRISSMFGNLKKVNTRVPSCINALVDRAPNADMTAHEQSGMFDAGVLHRIHPALYQLLGLPDDTDLSTAERPEWLESLDRKVDESERLTEEAKEHRKRTKGNLEMDLSAEDDDRDQDYVPPSRARISRPSPLRRQSCSSTMVFSPVSDSFASPSARPGLAKRSTSSGAVHFTPRRAGHPPKHPSPLQQGSQPGFRRQESDYRMQEDASPKQDGCSSLGLVIPAIVPVECAFYATEPSEPMNGRVLASVDSDWHPASASTDAIPFDDIHMVRDRYPNLRQLVARSHAPALHIHVALDLPTPEETLDGSMYLSARLDLSCAWAGDLGAVSVISSSVVDGPVMASSSGLGEPSCADGTHRARRSIELPVGFLSSLLEQTCGGHSEDVVVRDIARSIAPLCVPSTDETRHRLGAEVLPALAVLQEIVSRRSGTILGGACPDAVSEGTQVGDDVHLVIIYSFSLAQPGRGGVRIQTISFDRSASRSKSKSPPQGLVDGSPLSTSVSSVRPSVSFDAASPHSVVNQLMAPPMTTRRTRASSARNKANLSITLPASHRLEVIMASSATDSAGDGPIPFTPLDKINMNVPSAPPPINLQALQPRRLFGSADLASAGPYSGGGVSGSLHPAYQQQQQQQRHLATTDASYSFDGSPLPSPGIFAVGDQARQRMAGWTESQPSPVAGVGLEPSVDLFHPRDPGDSLGAPHSSFPAPSLARSQSMPEAHHHSGHYQDASFAYPNGASWSGAHDFDGSDLFDFASFDADGHDWLDQSFEPQPELVGFPGEDAMEDRPEEHELLF